MKIVVLAKEVPDTAGTRKLDPNSGILDRASAESVPDEINERALEHALSFRDSGNDAEIIVVSVVPAGAEPSIRKLLAMGADSAVVITDDAIAGSDAARTAEILASAVEKLNPDLVIAGNESTDGRGGVVPAMIAEYVGWPVLPALNTVEISNSAVSGDLTAEAEQIQLTAELPAIISITERSAEPRFPNFKGIMQAKKKPYTTWSLADLPNAGQARAASSVMVSATERPARTAGPKVVDDGSAATQLIDFLAAQKVI
ncbi:electron transfer flavoprotein subunit beta/FixA family protein [Leucobacter denitrificans]|uniref:Electron transfer flavoprotein subunit beta n=1 Tax=Leucobacter denitrificans TaxID=683042 RepID=A0A7G9S2A5_9MICO|nr:electron transfer flavoprotein subunit beta/FixA family protein [Leucobacter denitrificans]QNN61980.1 electron transfer flavoprotein subunit beta/FixA family protein [Leucobacter denitrificans]